MRVPNPGDTCADVLIVPWPHCKDCRWPHSRNYLKPNVADPIKPIQDAGFTWNSPNQRVAGFFIGPVHRFLSFACWRAVFDWCSVTAILHLAGRVARVNL